MDIRSVGTRASPVLVASRFDVFLKEGRERYRDTVPVRAGVKWRRHQEMAEIRRDRITANDQSVGVPNQSPQNEIPHHKVPGAPGPKLFGRGHRSMGVQNREPPLAKRRVFKQSRTASDPPELDKIIRATGHDPRNRQTVDARLLKRADEHHVRHSLHGYRLGKFGTG